MFVENGMFMAELSARTQLSAKAAELLTRIRKVMKSCVKKGQLDNAYKWGVQVIFNLHNGRDNRFLGQSLINRDDYTLALETIEATYSGRALEIEQSDLTRNDALFIQEIINDLERRGYQQGGKAQTMLHDWSRELQKKAGLSGKRKKVFLEEVGRENW